MKSNYDDEPSLEKIDDFEGKETPQKRNTVRLVIIGLIIFGAIYSFFRYNNNQVSDYVGTTEKPGINTAKGN